MFAMNAPEGKVADYFVKFRKVNGTHVNAQFINSVREETEKIISTVKEQQRRIY